MPQGEYLNPAVADLSVERKARKLRARLHKACHMLGNRQERIHHLQHVWLPNGELKPNAVEDWRECTWASCRNTRLTLDELVSEADEGF